MQNKEGVPWCPPPDPGGSPHVLTAAHVASELEAKLVLVCPHPSAEGQLAHGNPSWPKRTGGATSLPRAPGQHLSFGSLAKVLNETETSLESTVPREEWQDNATMEQHMTKNPLFWISFTIT
ncbi:uncharacterized protein [Pithys albifrons albifrons]|uniref:uncharacterized protein isoform X3 n=1 Tax=Pithys albifrons albifrons TaxID=3385563 RepID=UPI003A5D06E5